MDFILKHKIMIIILLIAIGGFFWYSSSSATPDSLLTTETSSDTGSSNKDLVSTLLTLRAVSLSGTILNDPSFLRLKDFSTQVILEDMGRPDPFSPLSATAVQPATTSAKSNQLFKAGRP